VARKYLRARMSDQRLQEQLLMWLLMLRTVLALRLEVSVANMAVLWFLLLTRTT